MDDVQENSCPLAAGPSLDTAANTIFLCSCTHGHYSFAMCCSSAHATSMLAINSPAHDGVGGRFAVPVTPSCAFMTHA